MKTIPFGKLSNENFCSFIYENSQMNESSVGEIYHQTLYYYFTSFNDLTTESNKKNPENFINCRNPDIDEIQKMENKPNSLSLFSHKTFCSLNKKFLKTLNILLKATNKTF